MRTTGRGGQDGRLAAAEDGDAEDSECHVRQLVAGVRDGARGVLEHAQVQAVPAAEALGEVAELDCQLGSGRSAVPWLRRGRGEA